MTKTHLQTALTEFLKEHQCETEEDAGNIATAFVSTVEVWLDDENTYGDFRWTPPDIIDRADEEYNVTITREQAITMFESEPLNFMKYISDMEYGWSLIDEAIEQHFPNSKTKGDK